MKLTRTQRRIVKTIQHLYRRKEPLNITAVKRRHPELMKAVYAVKPYWGWKKALETAGISYSDIKVELQDYCECEICHARKKALMFHIIRKHRIEMEDYRMDYPEADLICEEIRARRSKMKNKEMPHWEPLWSVEYALDRLWARYEKGMPINCHAIFLNEPSLTITLQRRFRFRDTTLSLHDMVLGKLGLNPEDIRRKPYSLKSKKEVLDVILKRWNLGLPLNSQGLKKGRHKIKALYRGATRMFGSWKKAIEAAGLGYNIVREASISKGFLLKNQSATLKYPTREKLLEEIRRRRQAGLPLNAGTLSWGGKKGDEALYRKGREFFGSWKKALKTAGIRYTDVVRVSGPERKYPSPEAVIAEIQRRYKAGLSIRSVDIHRGPHTDFALYWSAQQYFGQWQHAVKRAGFSYWDLYPPSVYYTPMKVIEEIHRRHREGIPIDSRYVTHGKHREPGLYRKALGMFGRWRKAVEAAGFAYNKVKLKRHSLKKD